jgi:hypothetical protein
MYNVFLLFIFINYKISYNSKHNQKQRTTVAMTEHCAVGASACEQKTPAAKPQELNVQ